METLKKLVSILLLTLCASIVNAQTDNFISAGSTSPYLTLGRGLQWGGTGFGTIGQNFIFHPLDPNQGFCVFLFNNNPTSTHSITVTVAQTGDPSINTYQGNTQRWTTVATGLTFPQNIPANTLAGFNYKTTASAGIVISFLGNTSAAGSPDTVDAFTVQTNQNSCATIPANAVQGPYNSGSVITAAGNNPVLIGGKNIASGAADMWFTGNNHGQILDINSNIGYSLRAKTVGTGNPGCSAPLGGGEVDCQFLSYVASDWGTTKTIPGFVRSNILEVGTDLGNFGATTQVSFFIQNSATNPGANATILHSFNASASTVDIMYKTAVIDCSAACEIKVFRTTSVGTTCTAITPKAMNIFNSTRSTPNASDQAESGCTTPPTTSDLIYDLTLNNVPYTLDLSGYLNSHTAATGGLLFQNVASVTGVVSVTLNLVENN